jgi:hypothetical protein
VTVTVTVTVIVLDQLEMSGISNFLNTETLNKPEIYTTFLVEADILWRIQAMKQHNQPHNWRFQNNGGSVSCFSTLLQ